MIADLQMLYLILSCVYKALTSSLYTGCLIESHFEAFCSIIFSMIHVSIYDYLTQFDRQLESMYNIHVFVDYLPLIYI